MKRQDIKVGEVYRVQTGSYMSKNPTPSYCATVKVTAEPRRDRVTKGSLYSRQTKEVYVVDVEYVGDSLKRRIADGLKTTDTFQTAAFVMTETAAQTRFKNLADQAAREKQRLIEERSARVALANTYPLIVAAMLRSYVSPQTWIDRLSEGPQAANVQKMVDAAHATFAGN